MAELDPQLNKEQARANRVAAKEAGETRYRGTTCRKCGGTERQTSSCNCVACAPAWRSGKLTNPAYREKVNARSRIANLPQERVQRRRKYWREWRQEKLASDPVYADRVRAKNRDNARDEYRNNPELLERSRKRRIPAYECGDYDRILEHQGGSCALCGEVPNGEAFHVDHCHETGVLRGVLCGKCNRAIGLLEDSPNLLRNAAEYLEYPPVACMSQ